MTFSTVELFDFKSAQAELFDDLCSITRNVVSNDSYGDVITTPTTTSNVPCRFAFTGGTKTVKGSTVIVDYDAVIYLAPNTSTIGLNDLITIVTHRGNTLNHTFGVYSVPEIGSSMKIKLKRKSN